MYDSWRVVTCIVCVCVCVCVNDSVSKGVFGGVIRP